MQAVANWICGAMGSESLPADIHVAQWPESDYGILREAIQFTLQSNKPDLRLTR